MSANPTQRKSDLLSEHVRHEIDDWLARYPEDQRQSAVLGALRAVQHEHGHLSTEMMDAVADYIGMPEIAVYEAGSFYSMFELQPVGKHSISVCTNISCMLRGGDKILEHLENKLGVGLGESTPDGRFFLKREEECLAGCCGAPMMQVNHVYHEHLTPERVDEILDKLD
ncbi:NADH dehydrogenase [Ectothiorhodospira haloalkaliphila]|uniref:NADH-quinone oxidoreductase subunit E n=1 Tax=Ectothiorhodospira haloalkaliphila TaxID=421628 RepID=W8KUD3_9GAMM|nr:MULTISPECIES: NADH-quinone oxidoreductase subunit NuoE [Ectothiorhodospira]AHK80607.1 NADH dehydrogenase [Ectothiorhodospira haloalkaliphila]MCG5493189.1 NADH-quinone oxidoreductase subunit NuoE [Ectothiorhodospira variabilis]MCG5497089.1 NADH-quinone oxidoreductase subunit NuoE [Ectothiorhodospira variabilis]MCG5502518.1 NADH-quinone oxidoreductase subunit NuoE [Ectothiorhodospira variabilis]MCG5505716.1 NADH-quinone oxidoreductase subunit NuoE [Ectothiorhodospira variabilis]